MKPFMSSPINPKLGPKPKPKAKTLKAAAQRIGGAASSYSVCVKSSRRSGDLESRVTSTSILRGIQAIVTLLTKFPDPRRGRVRGVGLLWIDLLCGFGVL